RHLLAAEVRREHLDLAGRREPPDRADHTHERAGPEVGQVVAVHARDHRVPQPHLLHRLRHPQRLEWIVERRLAGLHVAEAAAACAGVAEDHERGRAALPALADVGAGRLAADRVQPLVLDQVVQLAVARATGRRHLEPGGLALAERQHVAHLEHARAAGVGSRPGGTHPAVETTTCASRSNTSQKRAMIASRKWGNRPDSPVSLQTELICAPSIPHGTTHSNGWRSLSTFTAKPCVVTPRDTCTPIEPILPFGAHTPVSPPRTSASTPSSASAAMSTRSRFATYSCTPPIRMIG